MVSKRILIFGGNGQVGQALQRYPEPAEWHLGVVTRSECDLAEPRTIGKIFRDFEPDLVINAAAMTDIEACEKDPEAAMRINFHAVAALAAHCSTVNAPLVQLSTDYVFDGLDGEHPYQPDDAMNPLNAYGKSKLMGEEAARHGLYWHVILRTSLIFSAYGENVLTKTLRHFNTQDEALFAVDQTSNPTSADAVAEALVTISTAILNGKVNGFGTYHLSGEPAASHFEFAQAVMEAYAPYTDRRPRLTPVKNADFPGRVPRPVYTALNNEKIQRVYGIESRSWRDDLELSVKAFVAGRTA